MTPRRPGLTLLELIIVLTILAVLAGVATVATEGAVGQARYDATRRTLEDARDAIVGPETADPGSAGFVAHMGREPATPDELLAFPTTAAPQPVDSDGDGTPDATIAAGWRGPYLRLPAGVAAVRDGWGYDVALETVAAGLVLRSPGSDGVTGQTGDAFTADVTLAVPLNDYTGTATFAVREMIDGVESLPQVEAGDVLQVRVSRVRVNTAGAAAVVTVTPVAVSPAFTAGWTGEVGPVVVRAVLRDSAGAIKKRSDILQYTVGPRTAAVKKLILR